MSPTEAAVVYIPDDVECNEGLYARRGVAHIERGGRKFLGVLRNAERVIRLARAGVVVVFAKRAHSASLPGEGIKREFVGEETCALIPILDRWRNPMPDGSPRGDDGGFAERFLENRRRSRYLNARDT